MPRQKEAEHAEDKMFLYTAELTYKPLRIFVSIFFLTSLLTGFFAPSNWASVFNDLMNVIQWLSLVWLLEILHKRDRLAIEASQKHKG
jgi:hypothetical protein